MCDANSVSLFLSKFRFISSIVSPLGGPEETNIQEQSEQPQLRVTGSHTILRAMLKL
jgi:hypothetical protein